MLSITRSALLLFLCFSFRANAVGYAQTVSFSGKDVPLKTVFASVKKQTGYVFFYESGEDMLKSTSNVTLDLRNVPLEFLLKICLRDQPLDFSIEGTTIFIRRKAPRPQAAIEQTTAPPSAGIKGRVTNNKGEPLPNANVIDKRTGRGTVSDANGNFVLRNISPGDFVSVSYIGYKSQTVKVNDQSTLTLILEPASNDLDKVVVQAYGTTTQRLATGNIGTVSAEQIARQPVMNPLQALQGQVAGVVVTNTTGYASGTVKVEIRGRNTINPNFPSDPLYIIDGVPLTILDIAGQSTYGGGSQGVIQSGISSPAYGQSPFFSINPADIESIEVLKDADATAIYGSRGANGVILITTKKGKPGKMHLDMNVYTGTSKITRFYNLLNTHQYIEMRKEALNNDGLPIDIYNAPDLTIWDTTRYTDWQKFLWGGIGRSTDATASLSGGDTRTTFRLSGGYHHQTDILTYNGADQRGSFALNLNHKSLDQRFSLSFSGTYTLASSNMINTPFAITLPPNAPVIFDKLGNLNYAGWSPLNTSYPFAVFRQPYSTKTNLLNSNLVLEYHILKGLTMRNSFGYGNISTTQTYLVPRASLDPQSGLLGTSQVGYTFIHNVIVEPQLEYSSVVGKGKLKALIGASVQNNETSAANLSGLGYKTDDLISSIAYAPIQSAINSTGEYKYAAIFGRLNYNWADKFILNLNARRDGSSKFGPGRQYGNFGSAAAAYLFSEEDWVKKNIKTLSYGKLRISYGTTGGDQIGDYQYMYRYGFTRSTYNGNISLIPIGHADSTIHWQVNRKLEYALDLGFFKDRFFFEAARYINRCNDQLVNFPTPIYTGFTSVLTNSPANVQNSGWEFLLNARIIDTRDLKLSTKFNIGINRNKLVSYPNLAQSPYANIFAIGKSLNIVKVLHYIGVDPQTGHYAFADLNKDGQITLDFSGRASDDHYSLDLSPKYDGGFTTDLSYKNWQLNVFVYFKKQIGGNALVSLDAPGDISNQPTAVLSRWQKPGDITNIAQFTTTPYINNSFTYYQNSDAHFADASFIRLRNIMLAYQVPAKSLHKSSISNLRIFIQAENLFTITKYDGIDPEEQSFGTLPIPKTITGGITLNF